MMNIKKVKMLHTEGPANANIEFVDQFLKERGEPFVLIFKKNKEELAMLTHKVSAAHLKSMIKEVLEGVTGITTKPELE